MRPPDFHVCNLEALPQFDLDAMLAATALEDVWGIGRRIAEQLRPASLKTRSTSRASIPQWPDAAGTSSWNA